VLCGTQTANGATAFDAAAQQVLLDLQTATPKIPGFFAATKTPIAGNAIYAIAQCAETVTESGCLDCLTVGFTNIQGCFPNTDGEAFDAGCFMRYSQKSFFADNQTIDITPFLKQGKIYMFFFTWILDEECIGKLVLEIVCIGKIVFNFYS
jgi:hypothetical protein